jgi:capsular polysaccharide transport system permease protein
MVAQQRQAVGAIKWTRPVRLRPNPMQPNVMIKPSRPPSALAVNLAVVRAILLRDIRVQTGSYCIGLVVLLLVPLGHLFAVVIIFRVFGRISSVGTDQFLYYGVSILPYVAYIYAARQIMMSLIVNKSLLYFGRVTIFDIVLARSILEFANSVALSVVVILILVYFPDGFSPRDPAGFAFAIAGTIYFSFSFGVLNALIAQVVSLWALLFNLSAPLFWIGSGIVFFPSAIPNPLRSLASVEPVASMR